MKKACASINGATVATAGPGGAARRRSSWRRSRGASCFAGRLLTLSAALLLAACGLVQEFPPGPATPVPPNNVVVFGKVEVKIEGVNLLRGGLLAVVPSSHAGRLGAGPNRKRSDMSMGVPINEYFYNILPKEDYVFRSVKYFSLQHWLWPQPKPHRISCIGKVGFHVPPDAAAVYVGTLVFDGGTEPWPTIAFYGFEMTLSVKDEYDQSVRLLRERNPDFSGSIVKSLFRFQGRSGFTRLSPASDATIFCESIYEFPHDIFMRNVPPRPGDFE